MSAGFRAGTSNDGYLQINGTDILTVSSGVLGVKNTGAQSEMRLYCESNNAHYASLKSPPHSDFIGNVTFTLPGTSGSSGQVLQTDGSGNLSWVNQSGGGGGGGVSDKMSEGNTEAEVVDTGSDGHFKVTTEGVERLRINSVGEVGINNTSPESYGSDGRNLVIGNSSSNAASGITLVSGTGGYSQLYFADGTSGSELYSGTITYNHADNRMDFWTNGVRRLRINSTGEIVSYIGTLRRDVSTSSFTVTGDTASNTGANINLYGASHSSLANIFRVRTGATERLRVGPSGQIGLGGANYGTSGQVLTSGGASGAVSWTTISGGGGSYENSDVDNHLNSGGASSGQILSWNGSDYAWVADQGGSGGGGISDIVDDTTPQLGGNLDLNSNNITGTGTIPAANLIGTLPAISGASLTTLNASELDSGTIPDARFPATLPAASGTNLTSLPAANLTGTLPAISGANLTNLDASDLASGTIPDARFPATLPSASGANLTNLPAANITGTLPAISGANLTNLPSDTPADTDVQVTYDLSANGSSAYRFTGPGYSGADDNPDLYLIRGQRYRFINATGGHPFRIQSNTSGTAYTDGVSGSQTGTQDFNVQYNAPERLYYQCTSHSAMIGNIYIVGASDWRMTDVATSATPKIYTDRKVYFGMDTSYDNNSYGQFKEGISIIRADENGVVANATAAGEPLGGIYFNDARSGTYGSIHCVADGTPGTNDYPGRLTFRTASDGNSYTTERLRIDSSGRLLKSGEAALTSTSLSHPMQVAAASDANTIAIIGRASDDIGELSYYEADKSTKLGEVQYRQDHANIRHRVGDIRFATGGTTERLRITSGGKVLINQTTVGAKSAAAPLQLISSASGAFGLNISMRSNNDYGFISYTDNDASEDLVQLGVQRTAADTGDFIIYTNAGNTSGTEKLRIQSGGGISFNGDSAAANALDDYEEGTWTPAINAGSVSTYNWATGRYTKIGNVVTIWFDVEWTGASSIPSQGQITGLPINAVASNTQGGYGAPAFRDASGVHSDIRIYGNSSYVSAPTSIIIQGYESNGNTAGKTFNSSGRVTGWAQYFTTAP